MGGTGFEDLETRPSERPVGMVEKLAPGLLAAPVMAGPGAMGALGAILAGGTTGGLQGLAETGTPQGAATGTAVGAGSAGLFRALPMLKNLPANLRGSAGELFNTAKAAAGSNPVATEAAGQTALGALNKQAVGRTIPRTLSRFAQRVTNPDAGDLTYDEARDFYSAMSEMSANEKAAYTPSVKRLLSQTKNALGDAIQQTADNAGVGKEYAEGMSKYAMGSRLQETWDTVWAATKKDVIPWILRGVGAGAGYDVYRTVKGK
jgi:hypothetical protein